MTSRFHEPSQFKLYVCPVSLFNKTTLREEFSQYAEVVDLYMSDPNETGFKWAFIYFATEDGLEKTIREVEENNKHNFKLSRARPKIFPPPGSTVANTSLGAKMVNGVVKSNAVSYVAPPNCVHCRKLTFQQCVSCKNPFCSTECTLDGWRFHTSACVKVAELVKINDSNGVQGNALAPTVVNFMKDCKYSKKKFTSDEFADACNFRSMVTVSPTVPEENQTVDECENPRLSSNKPPHSNDKGSCVASLEPPQPLSEGHETDPWGVNDKPSVKTSHKKHTKRTSIPPRKQNPNRKYVIDNEDAEENAKEKTPSVRSYAKKYPRDSDNEEIVMTPSQNGHRGESKRLVPSKEPKIKARVPESDLKLKPGDSVRVVVTTIINSKIFYVANPDKMIEVLTEIRDCSQNSPNLQKVEINTLCLAFFDGDWYRARVVSSNPIEVEYIDYGNKAFRKIEDLKELPASLNKYLPLATKVQLVDGNCQEGKINENEEIDIYVNRYDPLNNIYAVDVL